jgi:predicted hotdog family 3-hydroxylacyl-ACP dehydratase
MLTREAIAALLPHDGAMVLLDEATAWDEARIACSARSHRDRSNPLRREGKLSSLCGVEYAAQAMALHGALLEGRTSREGMLASLRSVVLHAPRLDEIQGDLTVVAESQLRRPNAFIYSFSLSEAGRLLLEGQASVVLR